MWSTGILLITVFSFIGVSSRQNNDNYYVGLKFQSPHVREEIVPLISSVPRPDSIWRSFKDVKFIYNYIEELVRSHEHLVNKSVIGQSHEGRDLLALVIDNKNSPVKDKIQVLFDAGIHAREWVSTSTMLYLIDQFIRNYGEYQDILDNYVIHIIPIVNPDGYEYSLKEDRLWRKNRRVQDQCPGVDLNRNFPAEWNETGVSSDQCDETYPGMSALSEPESQALSEYMKAHEFTMYITFHSYGQLIAYPWGMKVKEVEDADELKDLALYAIAVMKDEFNITYSTGSSGVLLGAASGGSDDYAKLMGIKYSYTWELPDTGFYGFQVPEKYIYGIGRQTITGLTTMLERLALRAKETLEFKDLILIKLRANKWRLLEGWKK